MLKLFKNFTAKNIVMILIAGAFLVTQVMADLELPKYFSKVLADALPKGDEAVVYKYGLEMLGIATVSAVCAVIASFVGTKVATSFAQKIRDKVFKKVNTFSVRELNEIGTASLITRTTNDITQIQNFVVAIFRFVFAAPIYAIGSIYMVNQLDPDMAWILYFSVPVIIGIMAIGGFLSMKYFRVMQVRIDKLNLVLRENITGIRVIKAFNNTKKEQEKFHQANTELTDVAVKANQIMAFIMPIMMLFFSIIQLMVVWYGGHEVQLYVTSQATNGIAPQDYMAFFSYTMQFMFAIIMVSVMFILLPRAMASAKRINEILDTESSIKNKDNAITKTFENPEIIFDNVSFSFEDGARNVVENLSFTIKPKTTTAIIGGTGSGKSTILNLLLRFYDYQTGSIKIDGIELRDLDLRSLRNTFGYVGQNTYLFSGTIKDNILFTRNSKDESELNNIIDTAQATEFISNQEEGYNATVAQGGTNFSGGQKQRINIARALAQKAQILLFDDSFSALDYKTDSTLRKRLATEYSDVTKVIVAQRVSSIMEADQIIVLNNGQIEGIGTHKELLKTCEVYEEIATSQLSRKELGYE